MLVRTYLRLRRFRNSGRRTTVTQKKELTLNSERLTRDAICVPELHRLLPIHARQLEPRWCCAEWEAGSSGH
jgi:hypothetical protein